MSKARDILNGAPDKKTGGWMSWLRSTTGFLAQQSYTWGQMGYMIFKQVAWIVITTTMITAMPLLFEIHREEAIEEFEKMQVQAALAEGKSPQEVGIAPQGTKIF